MKELDELKAALGAVRGGVWSWEKNINGSWTLYSNRHAPIDPTRPARFDNVQHGYNILATAPDGFDVTGAELRAFIVAAHERLPAVLADVEAERKAWTQYAKTLAIVAANGAGGYSEEPEDDAAFEEAKKVLLDLGVDIDALTAAT